MFIVTFLCAGMTELFYVETLSVVTKCISVLLYLIILIDVDQH